jgi:hypothetical protein
MSIIVLEGPILILVISDHLTGCSFLEGPVLHGNQTFAPALFAKPGSMSSTGLLQSLKTNRRKHLFMRRK